MKQFISLVILSLFAAGSVSAAPYIDDEKPAAPVKCKRFSDEKRELKLSPNLKTGNITISFVADKTGKGTVVVLDEAGNTVLKQQVAVSGGKNRVNVSNFSSLAEGYYTVCINTNHTTYSAPFLLWK